MSQPDYENDLVFPPKEKMKKCNEKHPGECHCAFRCLSNEFCDAAEIRIKDLKEELQRLESDRLAKIEGEEIVAELNMQIKHLTDLQANQDKEVEILRDLLKECKNIVSHDLWSRAQFPDGQVVEKDDILTRINAAIGESEE